MGLKSLPPRIAKMPPRIAMQTHEGPERDRVRSQNAPWRSWYQLARWQELRLKVFTRDLYTCQHTGVICTGKHPAPNSPVADHREPHHGDPRLFWDENNVQTVSKAYHDSDKQAAERRDAW